MQVCSEVCIWYLTVTIVFCNVFTCRYLVTFSPLTDNREDPQAIIIWDVRTGHKKRGFHCESQTTWPIFKYAPYHFSIWFVLSKWISFQFFCDVYTCLWYTSILKTGIDKTGTLVLALSCSELFGLNSVLNSELFGVKSYLAVCSHIKVVERTEACVHLIPLRLLLFDDIKW